MATSLNRISCVIRKQGFQYLSTRNCLLIHKGTLITTDTKRRHWSIEEAKDITYWFFISSFRKSVKNRTTCTRNMISSSMDLFVFPAAKFRLSVFVDFGLTFIIPIFTHFKTYLARLKHDRRYCFCSLKFHRIYQRYFCIISNEGAAETFLWFAEDDRRNPFPRHGG